MVEAVIHPDSPGTETIRVEVTPEDVARGHVSYECPSCGGDGVVHWLPHKDEADCIPCSTRGVLEAAI